MATLDDKLLGEKLHYYCSSSDDEEEGAAPTAGPTAPPPQQQQGGSANTGPKGVIKDWQRFKQLESERREEAELERLALAKKLSLSCRTEREDAEERQRQEQLDREMESLLEEDDFMQVYMQKRMQELMNLTRSNKVFGELISLMTGEDFLAAIDQEDKAVTVIILLQEPGVEGCEAMKGCLACIARDYKNVKFCEIAASAAGLSRHFKVSGVPAMLVYRAGQLVASFVRLTDHLGKDFFANEVEAFLLEHAVLPDRETVPAIIRSGQDTHEESD